MTPKEATAELRQADASLRRYAMLLAGNRVDGALRGAYIAAARNGLPLLSGSAASPALLSLVHHAVEPIAPYEDDAGAEHQGTIWWSTPVPERAALLLTTVQQLPPPVAAQVLGVPEATVADFVSFASCHLARHFPNLESGDLRAIGSALADAPIPDPNPEFWAGVERAIGGPPPTSMPQPTVPPQRQPEPTPVRARTRLLLAFLVAAAAPLIVALGIGGRDDPGGVDPTGPALPPTVAPLRAAVIAEGDESVVDTPPSGDRRVLLVRAEDLLPERSEVRRSASQP